MSWKFESADMLRQKATASDEGLKEIGEAIIEFFKNLIARAKEMIMKLFGKDSVEDAKKAAADKEFESIIVNIQKDYGLNSNEIPVVAAILEQCVVQITKEVTDVLTNGKDDSTVAETVKHFNAEYKFMFDVQTAPYTEFVSQLEKQSGIYKRIVEIAAKFSELAEKRAEDINKSAALTEATRIVIQLINTTQKVSNFYASVIRATNAKHDGTMNQYPGGETIPEKVRAALNSKNIISVKTAIIGLTDNTEKSKPFHGRIVEIAEYCDVELAKNKIGPLFDASEDEPDSDDLNYLRASLQTCFSRKTLVKIQKILVANAKSTNANPKGEQ